MATNTLTPEGEALRDFRAQDWAFSDGLRSRLHNLHPYPARFIPQIPANLIKLFPPASGTAVLDPFCGSGTTLAAAVERALPAIGVDLNPIAALISKVKTTPLPSPLRPAADEISAAARSTRASVPLLPRLDHWFEADVQEALAGIVAQIDDQPEGPHSDALKLALSRIIVRVSNQDSDTRYAAVKKNVSAERVYELFAQAATAIDVALEETYDGRRLPGPGCQVLLRNILDVEPRDLDFEIGLVVTSPPYPNAYEYWLYHKYRMYWLGYDPVAVREVEIGARPHYFKKDHQTEHDFERQMGQCFTLLARVMRPRSYACFVVGNSVIHGRLIDNAELLARSARDSGFTPVAKVLRSIASARKSFNLSHARIKEESILVFRLDWPQA